ncbi:MAG: type IV toxin-antitoxin system AbiEi family antitoxin [Bacteroidota bacterium]
MLENDILYNAVENLKKWVHLPIDVTESEVRGVDAFLRIGDSKEYRVEIKRDVHKSNLTHVLKQISQVDADLLLLVSGSISRSAKEILEKESINYLDMAGNCFIKNDEGLYILIEGKKLDNGERKKKYVAFNKNGIKLLYAFLLNDELINQTYDVMASAANISKSTIGGILRDLKERQFLIQLNQKEKKLTNKQELLERWVQAYNEKLKPSLHRGKFRFLPNKLPGWKNMDLGADTFWGGEPAADVITDYLSPGEWTVYSKRSKNDLIKNLHLVPDPNKGNVQVYNVFWNLEENNFTDRGHQIVSPLLVYADLIGTNDNRNFETARKLYERELSAHFSK